MFALALTSTKEMRTLPVGLNYFIGQHTAEWSKIMAGGTVAIIPALIIFFLLQKHFVAGMTRGSVKG